MKRVSKKQNKDTNGVSLTHINGILCYKRSDIPIINYIDHDWDFTLENACFKHTNGRYYLSRDEFEKIRSASIKIYWCYVLITIGRRHFEITNRFQLIVCDVYNKQRLTILSDTLKNNLYFMNLIVRYIKYTKRIIKNHYTCKKCNSGLLIDDYDYNPCMCSSCENWNGCGRGGSTTYFYYCSQCKEKWTGKIKLKEYSYRIIYHPNFKPSYSNMFFNELMEQKTENYFKTIEVTRPWRAANVLKSEDYRRLRMK